MPEELWHRTLLKYMDHNTQAEYHGDNQTASVEVGTDSSGGSRAKVGHTYSAQLEKAEIYSGDKVTVAIDGFPKQQWTTTGLVGATLDGMMQGGCIHSRDGKVKVCVRPLHRQVVISIESIRVVLDGTDFSVSIIAGLMGVKFISGAITFLLDGSCLDFSKLVQVVMEVCRALSWLKQMFPPLPFNPPDPFSCNFEPPPDYPLTLPTEPKPPRPPGFK